MTTVEITSTARNDFVQSLDLATPVKVTAKLFAEQPPATQPGPVVSDNKAGNFIDSGSIVSFLSGLSAENQLAVLNSTLLAQLAANAKYDHVDDTPAWYTFYFDVLGYIGWQVPAFGFSEYHAAKNDFTMDEAVIDILTAVTSGSELAAVQTALHQVKALPDGDGRITLFSNSSTRDYGGSFQIGVASDAGAVVAMKLGAVYFGTARNVTNVFRFGFAKNSTQLSASAQALNLDLGLYNQVKAAVEAKLGNLAKTDVQNLGI